MVVKHDVFANIGMHGSLKNGVAVLAILTIICLTGKDAEAQWWNPLAPRDYNDCILKI
jgi:hypothetical protein